MTTNNIGVYDKGDAIRITATFTDSAGVLIDPGVVKFKSKNPVTGTITTLVYGTDAAVIRTSQGIFYTDLNLANSGPWWYRWESTGTGATAVETFLIAKQTML